MIDIIYHVGLLMLDRRSDDDLDHRAKALMKAAEAGQVTLVQRRIEPGVYEYHSRPIKGAR